LENGSAALFLTLDGHVRILTANNGCLLSATMPANVQEILHLGAVWTGTGYVACLISAQGDLHVSHEATFRELPTLHNVVAIASGDVFAKGSVQVFALESSGLLYILDDRFECLGLLNGNASLFSLPRPSEEPPGLRMMKRVLLKRIRAAEAEVTRKKAALQQRALLLDHLEDFAVDPSKRSFQFPLELIPMVNEQGGAPDLAQLPKQEGNTEAEPSPIAVIQGSWFHGPTQFLLVQVLLTLPQRTSLRSLSLTLNNGQTNHGGCRTDGTTLWVWAELSLTLGAKPAEDYSVSLVLNLVHGRNLAYSSHLVANISVPLRLHLAPAWVRISNTGLNQEPPPAGSVCDYCLSVLCSEAHGGPLETHPFVAVTEVEPHRLQIQALGRTRARAVLELLNGNTQKDWIAHIALLDRALACFIRETERGEEATLGDLVASDEAMAECLLALLEGDG
jgi:hypothetical protein